MSDFENIKEGDQIFISQHLSADRIASVTRVTATTFTAGKEVFRRSDGRAKGSSGWNVKYALPVTPERRAKARRQQMIARCKDVRPGTLTDEQLAAICAILDAPQPPPQAGNLSNERDI